jgi:hypothetical protein
MRACGVLALLLALPLAACQTDGPLIPDPFAPSKEQLAAKKAELAAKDDQTCQSYGAKPGTDIYVQCRMQQQQIRESDSGGGVTVVNNQPGGYVPRSDAPVLRNNAPSPVRCQTIGAQTVCH